MVDSTHISTPQPMGFGKILVVTFSLYRKHFLLFLGIIALDFCGNSVAYLLQRLLPDFPLKDLLTDLVSMPFGLVSLGGIIIATATLYLDGDITSRDALKQTWHRFWSMFACHLPWSLTYVMPRAVIAFFIHFILTGPPRKWTPGIDIESLPIMEQVSILSISGDLLSLPFSIYLPTTSVIFNLLPYSVWTFIMRPDFIMRPELSWILLISSGFGVSLIFFAVRWTLTTPAILLGDSRIRSAFETSNELTHGRWWRVLGILVSFSVLSFVIRRIGDISVMLILTATKLGGATTPMDIIRSWVMYMPMDISRTEPAPLVYTIISKTMSLTISSLVFPIWVIGITVLYLDLRVRKERTGIETGTPVL